MTNKEKALRWIEKKMEEDGSNRLLAHMLVSSELCTYAKHKCADCILDQGEGEGFCFNMSRVERWLGQEATITATEARKCYRRLCEVFNGSAEDTNKCIISIELMAERLNIPVEHAEEVAQAMFRYHITERQGGGIVI